MRPVGFRDHLTHTLSNPDSPLVGSRKDHEKLLATVARNQSSNHRRNFIARVEVIHFRVGKRSASSNATLMGRTGRSPEANSALQKYSQISSGAEFLFPPLMPEGVFSEVHP